MSVATTPAQANFNCVITRRDLRRALLGCALVFAVAIPVFAGLLVASIALPSDSRIHQHLKDSVDEDLLSDDLTGISPYGHAGHSYDMFSECVGLGMNLGNTDRSAMYRAIASPYTASDRTLSAGYGESQPCADLVKAANGSLKAELPYFRFWHGYQVYTRTLLSLMDLGWLRIANAILLYGSLLYLSFQLRDGFGPLGVAIFLLPYAIGTDLFTLPQVTVHALPIAISFFTAAEAMRRMTRERRYSPALFVFAFATGCVYNFVSMLFTPELVPALLAFASLAAFVRWDGARNRRSKALFAAGCLALAWFAGFALTWMAKWGIATAELGWAAVQSNVATAASGVHYTAYHEAKNMSMPFRPTLGVARIWLGSAILLANAAAVYLLMFRREDELGNRRWGNWLLLQSPMLIVIAWFETMRYHTVEHFIFAQRAMVLWVIFPLLALLPVLRRTGDGAAGTER